jgi:hypothetical protein
MATEYVTQQNLDALRTEIRGEFAELRGEMTALSAELRGEMNALKGELRGEMTALGQQLHGEMHALKGDLHLELAGHVRSIFYANAALAVGVGGLVLAATQLG